VTLQRKLVFFHNNHRVTLSVLAPQEDIMQEAAEYFTVDPQNCGEKVIWQHNRQAEFYQMLANSQGGELAQAWFDAFEQIVNTLTFQ